jgi:hypothetical protein
LGATWHVPGRASTDERRTRARRRGEISSAHPSTDGGGSKEWNRGKGFVTAGDGRRYSRRRHGRNLAGHGSRPRFFTRIARRGSWGRGEPNRGVARRWGGLSGGVRQRQRRLSPASQGKGSPGRGNLRSNQGKETGERGEAHRGLEKGKPAARKALDGGRRRNRRLLRWRGSSELQTVTRGAW